MTVLKSNELLIFMPRFTELVKISGEDIDVNSKFSSKGKLKLFYD